MKIRCFIRFAVQEVEKKMKKETRDKKGSKKKKLISYVTVHFVIFFFPFDLQQVGLTSFNFLKTFQISQKKIL